MPVHPRSPHSPRSPVALRSAALVLPMVFAQAATTAAQQRSQAEVAAARTILTAGCQYPAKKVSWEPQAMLATVYTMGSFPRELPRPYRQLLLEDLTTRIRVRLLADGRGGGSAPDAAILPTADRRYTALVLTTPVHFSLRGDGTLARFHGISEGARAAAAARGAEVRAGDTLFMADVRRALEEMTAERTMPPIPDRAPDDTVELALAVVPEVMPPPPAVPTWRLFRLTAPRVKPPTPRGNIPPTYPELNRERGIQGTLVMSFTVREDGSVDPESIQDLRRPGDIPPEHEEDYQEFVRAVRARLPKMRYQPAEIMGCRVRQMVVQPFQFGLR